jgi:hypothetical protein
LDSLSSIFGTRLLARAGELAPIRRGVNQIERNRIVEALAGRGYRVQVYRSDRLALTPDGAPVEKRLIYPANSIRALDGVNFPWRVKAHKMLASFIESDQLLSDTTDLLPLSLRPAPVRTGPLAVVPVWPAVLSDILSAHAKTLFLVHLLAPHAPYIFHRDGSLRPADEAVLARRNYDYADYLEQQRRYAEQVEYVNSRVQWLLDRLREAGVYDAMTIIVHGDHGSRIRWVGAAARGGAAARQDLLNQYSALLAIKEPGASAGTEDRREVSVLHAVAQEFHLPEDASAKDAEAVYAFDAAGTPHAMEMPQDRRGK